MATLDRCEERFCSQVLNECCCDGIVRTPDGGYVAAGVNATIRSVCRCFNEPGSEPDDRGGFAVQVAVFWGLVILFFCLCHKASQFRRPRDASYFEKVEKTKKGLVPAEPSDAACPVCLDVLGDDVVRPPGCNHVFHRACLVEWIDQAKSDAVTKRDRRTRDEVSKRMLACPMCRAPLVDDVPHSPINIVVDEAKDESHDLEAPPTS